MPVRIFTPQVLAHTGAKLSKSLLREQGKGALPADVEPWMLANIRQIYPPEREALGVVAIGIELVDPPPVGKLAG